jgi:DNA-binding XRE family transcriptional regulator
MDLTQEELAEELGITTIALQFIEQKRRYPSLPLLAYICKKMGLKVHIG